MPPLKTEDGTELDPKVLKVVRAIRNIESQGDYNAVGDNGTSAGAFQWNNGKVPLQPGELPANYLHHAREAGVEVRDFSKASQNKVAYSVMKKWKDEGLSPEEIAAKWNGAHIDQSGKLAYNAPEYGEKFRAALMGQQGGYAAPGMSIPQAPVSGYAPPVRPEMPQIQAENPVQPQKEEGNWLQKLGAGLIQSEKNFGESIAGAIIPFTGAQKQIDQARQQEVDIESKLLARVKEYRDRGEEVPANLLKALEGAVGTEVMSDAEFNPASQKSAKQVYGEALGVGADILSAGVFGKAATGAKTGLLSRGVGPTLTAPLTRSQGIIRGGIEGSLMGAGTGAIQGAARSMQENKNLAGIAGDTLVAGAVGGVLGGALGAGAGLVKTGVKTTKGIIDPNKTYNKRIEVLSDVSERNSRLRKIVDSAKGKGIDVKDILAKTNLLEGSVDNTGHINTQNAIDDLTEFLSKGTNGRPGPETVIMQNLEREGRTIPLAKLKTRLEKAIYDSGLEGGALKRALNNVEDDIAGYALKADKDGNIPLTLVQSAKIDKTRNINYLIPESKATDKAIAKGLREVVEENTTSIPVKELNKELQQHYQVLDYLDALNGKKVQGGKLGKYFAQTTGAIVGSHFGPLGSIIGAEVGGDILGRQMAGTFGKGGQGLVLSKSMKDALELANKPPVKRLPVKDMPTAFTDELPTIDFGAPAPRKRTGLPIIK